MTWILTSSSNLNNSNSVQNQEITKTILKKSGFFSESTYVMSSNLTEEEGHGCLASRALKLTKIQIFMFRKIKS